jgi:plasmid stability protein
MTMAAVTIRNVPEETLRALKARAAASGKSTEAEIRSILEAAVRPAVRIRIGSELAALGKKFGGVDLDIARDTSPAEPARFE